MELTKKEYETLQQLKMPSRSHINCVKCHKGESRKHFLEKAELAKEFIDAGCKIVTEAEFKNGGRADIINLTEPQVVEIVQTEKVISMRKKKMKYPVKPVRFYKNLELYDEIKGR